MSGSRMADVTSPKRCWRTRLLLAAALAVAVAAFAAQPSPTFGDRFLDRTLWADCSFMGNAEGVHVSLDRLVEGGPWAGPLSGLALPPENGRYAFQIVDEDTKDLLFAQGFDCLLGEYETTEPARSGVSRTFRRSLCFPRPRRPFLLVVEKRDRGNRLHTIFSRRMDPAGGAVVREPSPEGDVTFSLLSGGDPHQEVDLVFLAEGYTALDQDKFRADAAHAADWLFGAEPFKSLKKRFNVWGVFRASQDRGVSEPEEGTFKRTALGASFNALGLARYLLTEKGWTLRAMAEEVPCDAIIVLANSGRYGGGGIYNDYCITTVDNERSKMVLLHEFGHAFAGLADEYYLSEVAYSDFYPEGVEPLEPNITACASRACLKWRDLLSPGIPVPTPWGKEEADALDVEKREAQRDLDRELEEARARHLPENRVAAIKEAHQKKAAAISAHLAQLRKRFAGVENKVGLFEGAGYASHGLYRPSMFCLMGTSPSLEFCPVCQRAIRRTVAHYAPVEKARIPR